MKRLPVKLSQNAEDELDETWLFVARKDGFERADDLVRRLRERCTKLGSIPGLGRPYPHRPNTRVLSVLNFAVLYRVEPDRVRVLHIVHGARDLDPVFMSGE